jgi:hypothetical protein
MDRILLAPFEFEHDTENRISPETKETFKQLGRLMIDTHRYATLSSSPSHRERTPFCSLRNRENNPDCVVS